jgi:thiol-disulfide isomerase/thioredoxin
MNKKLIIQIVIVVVIIGAVVSLEEGKPRSAGPAQDVVVNYSPGASSSTNTTTSVATAPSTPQQTAARIAEKAKQYLKAKEITDPTGFINSPNASTSAPFALSQFVGNKVILLDFWTYSCINCERTIPYLNAWYQKYKDYGLEIVGVHAPEFDFEKVYSNVADAVQQYGIHYPVVLDSNMGTWNAYQNRYWPNEYLIDVDGYVVHNHIGEGDYAGTEEAIQAALKERDAVLGLPDNVPTGIVSPADIIPMNVSDVQSPETYFGAERNEYLASGQQGTIGSQTLSVPTDQSSIQMNSLYLGGTWNFHDQYAETTVANTKIIYQYNAKNVYFVAAASTSTAPAVGVKIDIILDGVSQGSITVKENKLYNVIEGGMYGTHTLELDVENPGLEAYTFTFG